MVRAKLAKLRTLTEGIFNYNIARHFFSFPPAELQINITYRCNSRCEMCSIWRIRPKNELSFSEWKRIMQDPIFANIRRLHITGGEPVMHPQLLKLSKLFLASMPKLQFLNLTTNGFLTEKTVAAATDLAKLSATGGISFSLAVSIDGLGKMHENIRHIPNAFEKSWATVIALKKLQKKFAFGLGVSGVVMRKNLLEIEKLEEWCRKHNIPLLYQLIGFHETYVNNLSAQPSLDFSPSDKKYLFKLMSKLARSKSLNWREKMRSYYWQDMLAMYRDGRGRSTPCPFLIDAFVLDSFGDVYYCLSERKIGNCRKGKTVSEIYYDSKNIAFRKKMNKTSCLGCNSGCFVNSALAKDFKKLAWHSLTGRLGRPGPL